MRFDKLAFLYRLLHILVIERNAFKSVFLNRLSCHGGTVAHRSDRYAPVPDKEIPTDNVKDGIITRWDITITSEDFKAVLGLVKPLYRHATHILSFLPSSEIPHRANADRDAFFDALGDEFTRTQLTEQATAMGIKPNTALSWLRRLVKKGLFVMKEKGTYVRARVCVC